MALDMLSDVFSGYYPIVFVWTFLFGLLVSKFISGSLKKAGANPFARDLRRPVEELVTDQKQRDSVLKQGFQAKKVPENIDAIVVGSGIGGLSVAALLSRAGYRVLVLEQHDQAGGCCHTFVEKGYEFDAGIHYIGEMRGHRTVLKALVDQLTGGQLQWEDLDDNYDVVALGDSSDQPKRVPIMSGREEFRRSLLKSFQEEEKAIDNYLKLLKDVRRSTLWLVMIKSLPLWVSKLLLKSGIINYFTPFFKLAKTPLSETLAELTLNQELRATLSYCFGDYGNLPSTASTAMHAVLINHFLYGVSYPVGGASEISHHVIPEIERGGGRVLVRAPVTQILVEHGEAVGVVVGRSGGKDQVEIRAKLVISDAGVYNTFEKLVPREVAERTSMFRRLRETNLHGQGALSLFVGLKGTAGELGLERKNMWAFSDPDVDPVCSQFLDKEADEVAQADIPLLFISFPSTKDPTWSARYPGRSTCAVITLARWEWFEAWRDERVMKRGDDYEHLKMAMAKRMWYQTTNLFPQLQDAEVEYMEIGTPLSNQYYLASPKGEIYGLDHGVTRFGDDWVGELRPETEIKNLYLTGQDVFICGFAGALFGGLMCASKILNRNLYDDLNKARKGWEKGDK